MILSEFQNNIPDEFMLLKQKKAAADDKLRQQEEVEDQTELTKYEDEAELSRIQLDQTKQSVAAIEPDLKHLVEHRIKKAKLLGIFFLIIFIAIVTTVRVGFEFSITGFLNVIVATAFSITMIWVFSLATPAYCPMSEDRAPKFGGRFLIGAIVFAVITQVIWSYFRSKYLLAQVGPTDPEKLRVLLTELNTQSGFGHIFLSLVLDIGAMTLGDYAFCLYWNNRADLRLYQLRDKYEREFRAAKQRLAHQQHVMKSKSNGVNLVHIVKPTNGKLNHKKSKRSSR